MAVRLGRRYVLKLMGAAVQVSDDGRMVVYMADDKRYEYLYRFVSDGGYDPSRRKSSFGLLDEGTLSVAAFTEGGKLHWLPLKYGHGKINENNGFYGQADVMIETRSAADLLGSKPMDRPEGIAMSPVTGSVYVTFSGNRRLKPGETNAPNPRPGNIWGHIINSFRRRVITRPSCSIGRCWFCAGPRRTDRHLMPAEGRLAL